MTARMVAALTLAVALAACSGADRETSACGEPTAFETEHLRELDRCGAPARVW